MKNLLKLKLILPILLIFILTVSSAWAVTYYVKNGGSDALDGLSDGNAWETIAKVNASSFSAGDSILFKCGSIWREQLTVPSSGSVGSPITFGAYGTGDDPVISGATVIGTWTEQTTGTLDGTFYPAASLDDGRAYVPQVKNLLTETSTRLGTSGANETMVRFRSVTVPKDAPILASYITFTASAGSTTGDLDVVIKGEQNATPEIFVNAEAGYTDYIARTRTTASVAWDDIPNWTTNDTYNTPSLNDIIAEITTLAGWASGNDLALFFDPEDVDAAQRQAYCYDNGSKFPALYIQYTGPISNVWKAICTTEPKTVIFDGEIGTPKSSIANLTTAKDWYWASNVLYVYSATDPDAAYTAIEAATRNHSIYGNSKNYITVNSLELGGGNRTGVYCLGNNWTVQNCVVKNGGGATGGWAQGIYVSGSNAQIDHNTVSYWQRDGILVADGSNNIIEYNDCRNNWNFLNFGSGGWGNGIQLATDISAATGTIVRFNYLKNNYVNIALNSARSSQVYYNILVDSYLDSILYALGNASYINYIYNNTIYHNPDNTISNGGVGHGISCEFGALAGNAVTIKNNLIYIYHTGDISNIVGIAIDADATDIDIDYNLVYKTDSATVTGLYKTDVAAYATLALWQAAISGFSWSGKSVHDISSNPLFVNPGTDFHLQPGSPCIDAGVNVGLTQDYEGRHVPLGTAPEMGAYEYDPLSIIFYGTEF